jgi:hypothetical protein
LGLGGLILFFVYRQKAKASNRPDQSLAAYPIQTELSPPQPVFVPTPNTQEVVLNRKQAEKENTLTQAKCDQRDLGHNRPIVAPLAVEPLLRPKPVAKPKRGKNRRLDEVEFLYLNTKGELKARHVIVHAVDAIYFKGYCLIAQASRTFRIDNVVGDITSLDTGEILDRFVWAEKWLYDELNTGDVSWGK